VGLAHLLSRIFGGRSRTLTLARSAELRSDLARAAALYELAGRSDEAARVRKARALAVLASSTGVPATAARRAELAEVAAELEALGELARAAEAYGRAQDVEGQARVLARSGEVDRLGDLLDADLAKDHEDRARRAAHEEFDLRVASGQRREAALLARSFGGGGLRARGLGLLARRVKGSPIRATIGGRTISILLGEQIVVGRGIEPDEAEPAVGVVSVASAAVSRRHLAIARRDGGRWIRDLASHNGTMLDDRPLVGEVRIDARVELRLGGEVSLVVQPTDELAGAVSIEAPEGRFIAPLGPAMLGIGRWRLEQSRATGSEDWVELVTDDAPPAFKGGLRLSPRITLLAGDAFAAESGGAVAIRIGE
jgi:hypothetical protein